MRKITGRCVSSIFAARKICELGVKKHPEDLRLKFYLAALLNASNRLEEALVYIDAISLGDKKERAFVFYNNAYIRDTADRNEVSWLIEKENKLDDATRERMFAKADKLIQKYVDLKRDDIGFVHYLRGKIGLFRKDYVAAAKYLAEANRVG